MCSQFNCIVANSTNFRIDPRSRTKTQYRYDLSNPWIGFARVAATKPLSTSTLRPLDNNTVRALCCFPVAAEAGVAAGSTAISRLPRPSRFHSTAARQTASSDPGPACSKPFHDCDKTRFVPSRSSGTNQPTALPLGGHDDELQLQTLLP